MGLSKQLYEEIEQFEQDSLNGEINEVDAYYELKQLEETIKAKRENIAKGAMRIIQLEKDYKLEKDDCIFRVMQKTTWNYKHITKWVEKKKELDNIQNKAKLAYQLSQKTTLVSDFENPENSESSLADINTGEVIDMAIPTFSDPFIQVDKIITKKQ